MDLAVQKRVYRAWRDLPSGEEASLEAVEEDAVEFEERELRKRRRSW